VDLEKRFTSNHVLERDADRPNVSIDFTSRKTWGQLLIPLCFLIVLYPAVNSAMALLLGILLALIFGNPYIERTRKLTRPLLAWSIVGLGAGVNLFVVLKAGYQGVFFTLIFLGSTLLVGALLGRWLKVDRETSALINVGTAICGGSAIAAVSASINAKNESTSVALGVVFILNAVGLFVFPSIGYWLELSQEQFGLWGAIAIHDTSSVVGATLQYGASALEVGTTVKLVRALWIIPIAILFAQFFVKETDGLQIKAKTQYPWFIGGFVLMSALVTSVAVLQPMGQQIEWIAKRTLVATLFLIGSGLTLATLKKVGLRSISHGVIIWILVATTSLIVVRWV